ncbi:MAG: RNA methyltransferase, partial [Okeania sp. SIO2H7]|nr:RNA methyltransferase [Okeania sp. SIO2H7]
MLKQQSTQIRIVLVEPAGPLNVGSVARIMETHIFHNP